MMRDPRTPVKYSHIANIVHVQSIRKCIEVSTGVFEDSAVIGNELVEEIESGSEIIIFDCLEENDLKNIADFIESFGNLSILIAGSAGLANHLHKMSFIRPNG